ncbi:MAG: GerMN domain-containing protein [Tissierellia bacterium]|nr:GerMN domain-containing protein [Tissierellia bacterium]
MRRYIIITLILIVSLGLAACTGAATPDEDIPIENQDHVEDDVSDDMLDDDLAEDTDSDEDDIIEPLPKTEREEVTLYFVNTEYIETGNEELDHYVIVEETIEYGDISIEEAIVKELMKDPSDSSAATGIPPTVKLLGVEVANDTAFVNFAEEGLFGSSLQEGFTIEQISRSLLKLNRIHKVQFLVNGEKVESLMGHFDAMSPFER